MWCGRVGHIGASLQIDGNNLQRKKTSTSEPPKPTSSDEDVKVLPVPKLLAEAEVDDFHSAFGTTAA